MAKQNIDFDVPCISDADEQSPAPPADLILASIGLKAGSTVCIRYAAPKEPVSHQQEASPEGEGEEGTAAKGEGAGPPSSSGQAPTEPSARVCLDYSGQHLIGPVPESARKRLASLGEELQGSVRSIKRNETGKPTQLLVRVQVVNGQAVYQGMLNLQKCCSSLTWLISCYGRGMVALAWKAQLQEGPV